MGKKGFFVELWGSENFEGEYEIFENCDVNGPAVQNFKVQGLVNTGFIDRGESDVDSIKIKRCGWAVRFFEDYSEENFIADRILSSNQGCIQVRDTDTAIENLEAARSLIVSSESVLNCIQVRILRENTR